jgi:hypothetical protein
MPKLVNRETPIEAGQSTVAKVRFCKPAVVMAERDKGVAQLLSHPRVTMSAETAARF